MSDFAVARVTLAVTNVAAMVRFYEHVFGADFTRIEAYGTTLYESHAHALPIRLCPNDIAGVEAQRSRHQFELVAPDFAAALDRAREAGARVGETALANGRRAATIVDPDDNTWVFLEPE